MTAKTSTQRGDALRKRREAEGLKEVRGIWAPKGVHKDLKEKVAQILPTLKSVKTT